MSTTLEQVPTGTYRSRSRPFELGFGVGTTASGPSAALRQGRRAARRRRADGPAEVRSIDIDEPRFKDHLLADDFFDIENTPTITFRSTDIRSPRTAPPSSTAS